MPADMSVTADGRGIRASAQAAVKSDGILPTERVAGLLVLGALAYLVIMRRSLRSILS